MRIRTVLHLLAIAAIIVPVVASAAPQCGTFEIVPTPNPGSSSNVLTSIAAAADGTAWATGYQAGGNGTSTLLLHYDGSGWTELSLPSEVDGVAFGPMGGTPDGDMWMIGTRSYTVYQVEVFCVRTRDGAVDRVDSFPNGGAPLSISATAADDVWSVSGGIWASDMGGYVQHFDGSGWTSTQLANTFSYRNDPQSIYAAGPDDVWIAGIGGMSRAHWEGYVLHWDGSTWEKVPTPFDGQNLTFFESIDGSGPDDIWISGHYNYSEDILLHWDGSSWTEHAGLPTPEPLKDIVVAAPDNAWVSPYSLTPGSPFFYFDGAAWGEGSIVDVVGATTVNWRGMSAGGACDVWAVGSYHDGVMHHTLAARLVPGDGGGGGGTQDPVVFVDGVVVDREKVSKKQYRGVATVTILDDGMNPVAGAAVTGTFSGPTSGVQTVTTDATGTAVFTTETIRRPRDSWCFTVEDVVAAGAVYDPASNGMSDACENGRAREQESVVSIAVSPTPFNPLTVFSFELEEMQPVSLEVYDVAGRRVATLADGSYSEGMHRVPWNAERHPSGVYLYRLRAGDDVRTGRITLAK